MAATVEKPSLKRIILRRRARRNALWPDAPNLVFTPVTGGWAQMPRTVPMIAALVDELCGRDKPGRLYITLWAYEFGDGFVEVPDPAALAMEAGYITNRAERTFNERIAILRDLGFVRTARLGLREHGFVLLLDPHPILTAMQREKPDSIPERWWTAFTARCAAIGIPLPGDVVGAALKAADDASKAPSPPPGYVEVSPIVPEPVAPPAAAKTT